MSDTQSESIILENMELYQDFIWIIIDGLSIDELAQLDAVDDLDNYYEMVIENNTIQNLFRESSINNISLKNIASLLYTISQNGYLGTEKEFDVVDYCHNVFDDFDVYIYNYLDNPDLVRSDILSDCSLYQSRLVSDYMIDASSTYSIKYDKWIVGLRCDCGAIWNNRHYNRYTRQVQDIRDVVLCCAACGRPSNEWKLMSFRKRYLKKTTIEHSMFLRRERFVTELIPMEEQHSNFEFVDSYLVSK